MSMQNFVAVAALGALAAGLGLGGSGAHAGGLFDRPATTPGVTLAASAKASASASAKASSRVSSKASSSAASSSRAGGAAGGCAVETETRAEVRRGDQHRVERDHDRKVLRGKDCAASSESRSRAELGTEKSEQGNNSRE